MAILTAHVIRYPQNPEADEELDRAGLVADRDDYGADVLI